MPWVVGFLERSDYTAKFDNHELALRHSPRFNAFLAAVQQATLEADGQWYIDEHDITYAQYAKFLTSTGINLTQVDTEKHQF